MPMSFLKVHWRLNTFELFKIGKSASTLPAHLLPHGNSASGNNATTNSAVVPKLKAVPVRVGKEVTNKLMGISQATCVEEIVDSVVSGFVVFLSVNSYKRNATFLAPKEMNTPPGKFLVVTPFTYIDPDRVLC